MRRDSHRIAPKALPDACDQFQWRGHQRGRPYTGRCSTRRLGVAVDQMLGTALMQMLQRERRAGLVAKQAFEPRPVDHLDTHRAIHREAAVMRPSARFGSVMFVDQAAIDECAQHTGSPARLHVGKRRRAPAHEAVDIFWTTLPIRCAVTLSV